MGLSGWHLMIAALVAVLIFGGSGRISSIMGDMARGIKSFKKGLAEDDEPELLQSSKVIKRAAATLPEHDSGKEEATPAAR
jgi:sec-independent protein translocase protein TatA